MSANQNRYKRTVAVDCDDVILNLIESWLSSYNRKFDDNLKEESITEWKISDFVKPEAKSAIYDFVHKPRVFSKAKPVEGALEAVNYMREHNSRIIYVTANDPMNVKFGWLKDHGFIEDKDDLVVASDKSLIIADMIIDDNFDNVHYFNGLGMLFTKPWNKKYTSSDMRNNMVRINGWSHFMDIMEGRI